MKLTISSSERIKTITVTEYNKEDYKFLLNVVGSFDSVYPSYQSKSSSNDAIDIVNLGGFVKGFKPFNPLEWKNRSLNEVIELN